MINEHELLSTTDAKVWAQEFMRLFGDRREDIDEGLMIGWFANAMAAQEIEMSRYLIHEFFQRMEGKI